MDDYVQDKRDEAKKHRGVWYDSRADKFAAEIYSQGERHFLGHFATAEEAAAAYTAERAERPSGRAREGTFTSVFAEFLDTAQKDAKGTPLVEETLVYKGQEFYFDGVVFRGMRGKSRPFYKWISMCSVCGRIYDTMTATTPAVANGITRNCEAHRKGRKPVAKAKAAPAGAEADWAAVAHEVYSDLLLCSETIHVNMFLAECHRRFGGMPSGFKRFVVENGGSPVALRGEYIFSRTAK